MEAVTILIDDELYTIDEAGELLEVGEWWQRGDEPPKFETEQNQ